MRGHVCGGGCKLDLRFFLYCTARRTPYFQVLYLQLTPYLQVLYLQRTPYLQVLYLHLTSSFIIWLLSIHSHWSATEEIIRGDIHGLAPFQKGLFSDEFLLYCFVNTFPFVCLK